jgi:hypothetical protein
MWAATNDCADLLTKYTQPQLLHTVIVMRLQLQHQ